MKKQGVVIGILVVCLALLGGGVFLLRKTSGDGAEREASLPQADPAILKTAEDEITGIEVENASGGFLAVPEDGTWTIAGLEGIPLEGSLLHTLVTSVTQLNSIQEIEDGDSRREEFGLTEERASAVVKIQLKSGDRKIVIGDEVPGAEKKSRYVGADERVCVVYQTKTEVFLSSAEDFLRRQLTPAYSASTDSFLVESVRLGGSGFASGEKSQDGESHGETGLKSEEGLLIRLTDSSNLSGVDFHSYEMESPWTFPADPSRIEDWLYSFFNMTAAGVEKIRPQEDDLEKCGLSVPWAAAEVTYRDGQGTIQKFVFDVSEPDSQGNACALLPDIPVIYRVNLGPAVWASADMKDLVSRQLLSPSILTLSSLTLVAEGREPVTIEMTQDPEARSTAAGIGGKELEDRSFRNFYYTVISQMADEVILEETPVPGGMTVAAEITFAYEDKTRQPDVITYYRETDRTLYVAVNGGARKYRMGYAALQTVLDALQKLEAGEEVKARY